jgi:hypothetical protein
MMIQTAAAGASRFVMTMDEHTALAGQFARAFGNSVFEPVQPREIMLQVIDNHDKGWAAWDAAPRTDPATGLPYNLLDTPIEEIVTTSAASPDFNEGRHPYGGLMSSMHSWGLYNGRYGMSDKVLIDGISPQSKPMVMHMLEGEVCRQKRLKAELASDPATAGWIEEGHLFQNYKQLQFFDTLALYFNRTHEAARRKERFAHVPMNAREDTAVAIEPTAPATYALRPYPFNSSPAAFRFCGRYIEPRECGSDPDWVLVFASTPTEWQSVTLIRG